MNQRVFIAIAVLVGAAGLMMPQAVANPYYFYAGYIVLQYVVIATGWNILGGYAGYINFGTSAFFGAGVYTAAFLFMSSASHRPDRGRGRHRRDPRRGHRIPDASHPGRSISRLRPWRSSSSSKRSSTTPSISAAPPASRLRAAAAGLVQGPDAVRVLRHARPRSSRSTARWIETTWMGRSFRAIRASEPAAEACGVRPCASSCSRAR